MGKFKEQILMYVTGYFPFFRTDVTKPYGEYLPKLGIKTSIVIASETGKEITKVSKRGIDYYISPEKFPRKGINKIPGQINFLFHLSLVSHLLKTGRFSFFQIRNSLLMGFFGLYFRKRFQIKLIFQYSFPFHLYWREDEKLLMRIIGIGYTKLLVILLNRVDYILPISQWMIADLEKIGVINKNQIPLRMGIEEITDKNEFFKEKKGGKNRKKTIFIYVGSLNKIRELEIIFHAFKGVLDQQEKPSLKLFMVGEGTDRKDLEELSYQIGISQHVKFFGFIPRKEVLKLIYSADVGLCIIPVNAVFSVSSPTKLYEYLGCGVPVIGTKLPEIESVIKECKGGITITNSIPELIDAMNHFSNLAIQNPSGEALYDYILRNHSYKIRSQEIFPIYSKQHIYQK